MKSSYTSYSHIILLSITLILTGALSAQTKVSGTITDKEDGEALIGASVVIPGTSVGTATDLDGKFELNAPQEPPFTLVVSYTGYESQNVEVTSKVNIVNVKLNPASELLGEVSVVSRQEETILETAGTVELVGIKELRSTPSFDVFSTLSNLKGVQTSTGGLTFSQINTRGFADMQNWRFVTLVDGMDVAPPGLNFAVGGNSAPADIDIAAIELVPGASSALYGANAFNGLLAMKTKDPYVYEGLSAYVKGGVTAQDAGGTNPLIDGGFRYARKMGDRFAFKMNFSTLHGTDWTANDSSFYVSTTIAAGGEAAIDAAQATPYDDLNYDAVNRYGDELSVIVDLGADGNKFINRTGIWEDEIVDYSIQQYKADASVYYKLGKDKDKTISYLYRYLQSDAILRHTTIYPLRNLFQQWHKLTFSGDNFEVKAYYTKEDAADSYAMLATGAFIEEGRLSSAEWSGYYSAAYNGAVTGVSAGDHSAARKYADSFRPGPETQLFQDLRSASLENSNIAEGGSKFIDRTTMFQVDGLYDFEDLIGEIVEVQAGANLRRYNLESEGKLFNDGPMGFNAPIPILEYGAFLQLGKKFLSERIALKGSVRYDKNQNFEGRFTPRASVVVALDKDRRHFIRGSFQTGFRNPATQETYIALDVGRALLYGGVEENWTNSTFVNDAGTEFAGIDIYNGLRDLGFEPVDLEFIKQEQNRTFEVGYKGLFSNKLYVDANYFRTRYDDFVYRQATYSVPLGRVFLVYTNIDQPVNAEGAGLNLQYTLPQGLRAGVNYSWAKFSADDEVFSENVGFLSGFNSPEHRFNVSVGGNEIAGSGFGFDMKFRWSGDYRWESPFGVGDIPSYNVVDLAVFYQFDNIHSVVKAGANNLLMKEYINLYGGPNVGSIFYVGWTFDQILK